ncbi:MAG: hypothetical protein LBO74_16225 [Candidatus Symbiothrix sp.]|jgi:hypothetical protein|nr:hypothetical protein [Candidatus Symbiothrix sp.]
MKIKLMKLTILFAVLATISLNVNAQITVGSLETPEKGMLLELKSQKADAKNVTVANGKGGGLGFPRVELVNKKTLEPFIDNDADFKNNTNKVKDLHVGMVVYNLSASGDFQQGLYVWKGVEWEKVNENKGIRFFYMPPFNIALTKLGPDSLNLYEEYERQFTKTGASDDLFVSNPDFKKTNVPTHESGRLHKKDELDYVITYYDKRIIDNITINNEGVMKYTVKDTALDSIKSYINVVLVVK